MMKFKQNRINKKPEETLITSPAMIVDKMFTIQVTMNALHRKISKRMQKHS